MSIRMMCEAFSPFRIEMHMLPTALAWNTMLSVALIRFKGMVLRDRNWSQVSDLCVDAPESYTSISAIVGGLLLHNNAVLANVMVNAKSSPPVAVLANSLSLLSFFFFLECQFF